VDLIETAEAVSPAVAATQQAERDQTQNSSVCPKRRRRQVPGQAGAVPQWQWQAREAAAAWAGRQ